MLIARIIVSCLYALLMLFAVLVQLKKTKKIDAIMLSGAMLLLVSNLLWHLFAVIVAAEGLLIIHAAALKNGKNNGKINVPHHLVRLLVSAVIFALFLLS